MPGVVADDQDVLEVYRVPREAADRARAGEGPTLIEAKTHRLTSHSSDDDQRVYREAGELEKEAKDDVIPRFRQQLLETGMIDDQQDEVMRAEIASIIDAATEAAEKAPYPDAEDTFLHVYGEGPPFPDDLGGGPRMPGPD